MTDVYDYVDILKNRYCMTKSDCDELYNMIRDEINQEVKWAMRGNDL